MVCNKCGNEMLAERKVDENSGAVIGIAHTCVNRQCSEYLKPVGMEETALTENDTKSY